MRCDSYLVFNLAIFVSVSWDERRPCAELRKSKPAPWGAVMLVEHNCQEDFSHLKTSKLSTCGYTETQVSDIQGLWILSTDGRRSHEAINEKSADGMWGSECGTWNRAWKSESGEATETAHRLSVQYSQSSWSLSLSCLSLYHLFSNSLSAPKEISDV